MITLTLWWEGERWREIGRERERKKGWLFVDKSIISGFCIMWLMWQALSFFAELFACLCNGCCDWH